MITYFQAIVMGLVQGVTELFPISSLAQAVILPTVLGWDNLSQAQSQPESFFVAFLVGLHVATARHRLRPEADGRKKISGYPWAPRT
jgi:undecaprenyl-diphosphatase